jgi:P pilus assembly chaperone PapD
MPAILSEIFVLFVLSAATEVVMFTNRSNYPSDADQRQLTISRGDKNNKALRQGRWEQSGMLLA